MKFLLTKVSFLTFFITFFYINFNMSTNFLFAEIDYVFATPTPVIETDWYCGRAEGEDASGSRR